MKTVIEILFILIKKRVILWNTRFFVVYVKFTSLLQSQHPEYLPCRLG